MTTIESMNSAGYAPLVLGPNQPDARPYRGGAGIARFRGTVQSSPFTPEDFVASTTEVFSGGGVGLSLLPDGRLLRDAIAADPVGFLGDEHVRRHGANSMLLVKLLDTAERLFVHYHPDDAFAARHLSAPSGKTEAWVIIDSAEPAGGYASLGFNRSVSATEVEHWFAGQAADDMLAAMNRVPLAPGDTLLVPAGLPHAIGPGLTLVELQQPTDLSILLEYDGYNGLGVDDALLGLDLGTAIQGLRLDAVDAERLELLATRRGSGDDEVLFPGIADRFFSAERLRVNGAVVLEAAFSVLVVLDGAGELHHDGGSIPLHRGQTLLTAHAGGALEVAGDLTLIRARPPR